MCKKRLLVICIVKMDYTFFWWTTGQQQQNKDKFTKENNAVNYVNNKIVHPFKFVVKSICLASNQKQILTILFLY